jgi:hypothetical protein
MTPATLLIAAIQAAKEAEATARLNRLAAVQAFAEHVKDAMKRNCLDSGTLRRRLGWPESRLGNFLHLGHCLAPDRMAELGAALGPMSADERAKAKWQPLRTKTTNS